MTFAEAMYNCMLRRMELVAFDTPNELHSYWINSSYYSRAMGMGEYLSAISVENFHLRRPIEIIHYWTAGAAVSVERFLSIAKIRSRKRRNKIVWCSTNKTTVMDNKLRMGKTSKEKCLAFSKWTETFQMVDCDRKLSFICEVSRKIIHCINILCM
jgi:hypothetical protein